MAKKRILTCDECGEQISLNDFEDLCLADARDRDEFRELLAEALCPYCESGDLIDERELEYQQKIMDEIRSDMAIAKAYPGLYDSELYAKQMRDAGRGNLVREVI